MDHPSFCVGWDNYRRLDDYQDTTNYVLQTNAEAADYDDIPTNSRKTYLIAIFHRISRQQLNYRNCNVNELRTFAIQRRLATAPAAPSRRKVRDGDHKRLVRLLEAADESATFPGFLDLSAKLRCLVYEHYVASLPKKLQVPAQPPIAKVNKLLRTESLPIFYHGCQIQLHLQQQQRKDRKILKFSNDSQLFLNSLAPKSLAEIHSLHIACSLGSSASYMGHEIDIQLKKSEKAGVQVKKRFKGFMLQNARTRSIEVALSDFFNQESQRKKELTIEGVYAARRKLEDTVV
ncbi:hypothetical protein M409DRAFT_29255 [Zasmidium cellare ATCC 36951]|uniref:Uncharacterized protein n=1 Tax=Zasmidium cellare ATCC 36951 TaxID=1080233 RepID=A0A6A6C3T7_ZASCE|nr:uncharacterized protein M409DRAFT_29255 [Zasmidium cellare ATCC 36951]KAF2160409.1 hypothetical protein M409DRAFT_29255 [Zasmidium cellare ATCC 36951]